MMMLDSILRDAKKQLSSALIHKKHSFRYFTFTTLSLDGGPHSRTVVLRGFDPKKLTFSIYTDSRSEKIKELNKDSRAEFLFYDSKQLLQLAVKVHLIDIIPSEEKFYNLPDSSKKDYCVFQQPGTPIKGPEGVYYDFDKGYLIELNFEAVQLEYLKLKRPNHIRAKFHINQNWEGVFITP